MIENDFDDTLAYVCAMYAVPKDAVMSRDRSRRNSYARGMVAILMRQQGYSYPAIGRLMKREHTSVMRMVRLGKKIVDRALKHFMTREELYHADRLAEEAKQEAEAIRVREIASAEEALRNVVVMRPELRFYDRECRLTRQWLYAVHRTMMVEPARKESVWKDEMTRLFPFTAGTPTAVYGEAQTA